MKPIATVSKSVSISIPRDIEARKGRKIRRIHKAVTVSSRVPHPHPLIIIPLILIPLLVGMIGSIVVLSEEFSRPSNEGDMETMPISTTPEAIDMKEVEQFIDDIQKMVTSEDLLGEVEKHDGAAEDILMKSLALIQRFQKALQASLSYQPDKSRLTEKDKDQVKLPIPPISAQNGNGDVEVESGVHQNQEGTWFGDSAQLKLKLD